MSNLTLGRDGKFYMSWRHPAELERVIGLCHALACAQGLSRRQVQRRLADLHVRRSVGAISQYLARYECRACAAKPAPELAPPAPPRVEPAVISWWS